MKSSGFSLIEVIVAVAVFSVVAVLSYSSISSILKAREVVEDSQVTMLELQRTYGLLKNDLRYAILRSVRNEYDLSEYPFLINQGGFLLQFTTHFPDNQGGKLLRVIWRLEEQTLIREQYLVLDRLDAQLIRRDLLDNVSEVDIYVYESQNDSINRQTTWENINELPLAIEWEMEREIGQDSNHSYRWLFDLPKGI